MPPLSETLSGKDDPRAIHWLGVTEEMAGGTQIETVAVLLSAVRPHEPVTRTQ